MPRQLPAFLQVLLLASLAIRLAVGAPCCWDSSIATQTEHVAASHHEMHAMGEPAPAQDPGHEGHDEGDNRASPCCSACGPILAGADTPLLGSAQAPATPRAFAMRDLPPRDFIRLYEATGPPSRV